ncbi:MAG TPA: DUF790 family protein [Ktedonobacterales bacterium]|nr:DUF790 family protein [Ktedonobacterales bacterium]
MLKLADLRKTTRRAGESDLRIVHPRFLRDRALAPRIELAIRYLESMLGKRRRDLDAEVVVQLFGDHKLARCIVACLAATYRHRPRAFAEILPADACDALAACRILTPSDLRLWVFRRVNADLAGFAGAAERAPFLRVVADELGLPADQVDTLLALDTPANAVLTRSGPQPTADDVIARFNYETTAALLANASLVRVALRRTPTNAEAIRAACAAFDVRAELSARELVLHGRQDSLNGWARHGARLVRLLVWLLLAGLPARSAEALVANPTGADWLFRLDAETLGHLGATQTGEPRYDLDAMLDAYRQADTLASDFASLRRFGDSGGWRLRRTLDPIVTADAVLPGLFVCIRGDERVPLALASSSSEEHDRLAATARRMPLVRLAFAQETSGSPGTGAHVPSFTYVRRGDAAALPELLAQAAGGVARRADAARVEAAIEEAQHLGVVTEPRLAELLGCAEEDVALRLALPAARAARQERGVQYVEGFGLCAAETLARAREAAADVARLRSDQPVGEAWVVRQLGRRLRQVTGASAGIECLIAYLGAA